MVQPGGKYLTKDEIARLLVSIDNRRDRLLIQLGLSLGCRVSEAVNIRLKHIVSDRIRIWDEKKDLYRDCVIDQGTRKLMDEYLANDWEPKKHIPHKLFYFSTKTANRIFKRWCFETKLPGEKAHFHTLRHTYIIQSLDAGVPINHVVEQTGNTIITIMRHYGRPSIDSRNAMMRDRGVYWA